MIVTYTNAYAVQGQTILNKCGSLKLLILQHCHDIIDAGQMR